MIVTVSPWVVWGVLSLALFGVVFCWRVARGLAADALERWRDWRADREEGAAEEEADALEDLPPERTWDQLTHHELPLVGPVVYLPPIGREPEPGGGPPMWEYHRPERERGAPWWEAEHRAAYESLGFDYPSGLLARVREAGQ